MPGLKSQDIFLATLSPLSRMFPAAYDRLNMVYNEVVEVGVVNLRAQNKALLLKHVDKFYNKRDILWVT